MDLVRQVFDSFYDLIKNPLFYITRKNPEVAHDLFILFSKILSATGLEKLVLDNKSNYLQLPFEISNAAGFDKNARLSPKISKYLRFDRIVIGTVTGKHWLGNKRPRIKRDSSKQSLFNNIAWDNDGAKAVANRLKSYKNHEVKITINIGPTPEPKLSIKERLKDLEKTIKIFRDISYVDRFEYCPSCPNIKISREENQELSGKFTCFIKEHIYSKQNLYIKVSPDLNEEEIDKTISLTYDYVKGYVTTNTTTRHDYGEGAGSGNILYPYSLETQKKFYDRLKDTDKEIIACGGIDSLEKVKERIFFEPQKRKEIQLFTPIIFSGTKLLREFRYHRY